MDEFALSLLKETSRSFFYTITETEDESKRRLFTYMYLVLRVLDTLEDDAMVSPYERSERIESYLENFWLISSLETRIPKYKRLMDNIGYIHNLIKSLPETEIKIITDTVQEMGNGMIKFLRQAPHWIDTEDKFEEYCQIVAGNLTIPLCKLNDKEPEAVELHHLNHFARFLQMVNIIRDIKEDIIDQDRCYWPIGLIRNKKPNQTPRQWLKTSTSADKLQSLCQLIRFAFYRVKDSIEYILNNIHRHDAVHPFQIKHMKQLMGISLLHVKGMYGNLKVYEDGFVLSGVEWKECQNMDMKQLLIDVENTLK